ncbi:MULTISPECIES: MucR family transcriptional regulator [Rhizobium]|uniref:MucR family transcriptional regulator n=1 Tax=Rhizobium tropici TaxID=398 RepID=A0A329Y8M7_RHITR|nr:MULTISPECIES: MucR family transcriptional regulator [Rhizobium]MBB3285428.1 putative transcriptional regulator [Rhizobium sp. BK252]MBB3400167.1 putative transcriptional regulator [Rhizobium sp. BK289]MBB3412747.1 putative transcriptional regulator [Rhizobium sp. BK284]MBB3480633.1 putative transcriptional regulator [Rhizobium sp. BK347]MDK4719293.1 MucR family transcriptional regulator [Rhizobium sp. CNPSo 3968]
MKRENTASHERFIELTSKIVSAYVLRNATAPEDLPRLIIDTYAALTGSRQPEPLSSEKSLKPAVPIKKSITDEYLICLEDGGKYKSLKRHLNTKYGLTPEEYRKKWGLPADYPMVSATYAATRSTLAKKALLGHTKNATDIAPAAEPARRQRKTG